MAGLAPKIPIGAYSLYQQAFITVAANHPNPPSLFVAAQIHGSSRVLPTDVLTPKLSILYPPSISIGSPVSMAADTPTLDGVMIAAGSITLQRFTGLSSTQSCTRSRNRSLSANPRKPNTQHAGASLAIIWATSASLPEYNLFCSNRYSLSSPSTDSEFAKLSARDLASSVDFTSIVATTDSTGHNDNESLILSKGNLRSYTTISCCKDLSPLDESISPLVTPKASGKMRVKMCFITNSRALPIELLCLKSPAIFASAAKDSFRSRNQLATTDRPGEFLIA